MSKVLHGTSNVNEESVFLRVCILKVLHETIGANTFILLSLSSYGIFFFSEMSLNEAIKAFLTQL